MDTDKTPIIQFPDYPLKNSDRLSLLQGTLLKDDDCLLAKQIIEKSIMSDPKHGYLISMNMSLLRDAIFTIEQLKKTRDKNK